ncbi:hypothetical protein NIES2107_51860 [Nostoc carneum NIES-2107]|nr:hypothetical protein NIES2107_51860 [Nostoc carneum NIES-2107]
MQKFIWLTVFLILFVTINSKNSSLRYTHINPYIPDSALHYEAQKTTWLFVNVK